MSSEEALALLSESKKFLEAYKMYGQIVTDTINYLTEIEKLITDRSYQEAYKLSTNLVKQLSSYRSFIPDLAVKIDRVNEILNKNCGT